MVGIGTFIMLGIVAGSICISLYLFLDERLVACLVGVIASVVGIRMYILFKK